ncbi:MAG: YihY/virulence factor BrkB family protein [Candidatus Kapaibacteriales bacterium]
MPKRIFSKEGFLYKAYKYTDEFFERASHNHLYILAAGIAFNILLYLIPLFWVTIFVLGFFFSESDVSTLIQDLVYEFLPPTEQTRELLGEILSEVSGLFDGIGLLGIISIVVLLWLSSTLISGFRHALNSIYHLHSKEFFLVYRLKDILLTIVLTVLVILYAYLIPLSSIAVRIVNSIIPEAISGVASGFVLSASTLIASFILFYFIYRWVPNVRIARRSRMIATVSSVIMIELARYLFAWYITALTDYGRFYGTYGVIISVALWVFYSSIIILMSAELGKYITDIRNGDFKIKFPSGKVIERVK